MVEDYDYLLEKAYQEIPKRVSETEGRFVIEKVAGHLEGNKTIITNLKKIADKMERPLPHLLKFLQRELASPGKIEENRVIFGTKLRLEEIDKKIEQYLEEFVVCPLCRKPDTQLIKIHDIPYLKCLVCGQQRVVKKIK